MRRSKPGGRRGPIFDYTVAEDVDRELAFHLEMRTRELIEAGWDPGEARAEALRLFGDPKEVGMECREITSSQDRARERAHWLQALWRDLRFAARGLGRSPAFAAVAVLTLTLGIGANTAIFSVVNGVLLEPLPYPEPDRLVRVREVAPEGFTLGRVAYLTYTDWRENAESFSHLAAYQGGPTTVLGGDRPLITGVAGVGADFLPLFRVQPVRGRALLPEDFQSRAPGAVVSHRFWRNHLGATGDLTDTRLEVLGFDLAVVGVLPPGFDYPNGTDIWFPLELFDPEPSRTGHNSLVIARLRDDATLTGAQQEMSALAASLSQAYPDHVHAGASVVRLHDLAVAGTRRPLLLLLGAAGLVLLVACVNIASTLLARGETRQRELAIRASIGADRGRLVRQLFTESLLIAALGCVAGLAVAYVLLSGLLRLAPADLPRLETVGLDLWAMGFALAIALATAVLFGLLPAFRTSTTDVSETLRAGGRGSAGGGRGRMWSLLVGTEVALALVLLVGAGLLIKSFWGILTVDPGFDATDVLTVDVTLPATKYEFGDPAVADFHRRLQTRLEALPGVERAGLMSSLPLSGSDPDGGFAIEGRPGDRCFEVPDRGTWCSVGSAGYRVVSAGYFGAMDIPLERGRMFSERDDAGAPMVMLINETMARRFWPTSDPIGQRVQTGGMDRYGVEWTTIIGIVGDVRHDALSAEPDPEYYVHYLQRPDRAQDATVVIESSLETGTLIQPVRAALRQLDPDVPAEFTTMASRLSASVADRRFTMLVLSIFAALALILAAVGIYGVVSYSVAQRTREIGIRMAMGAEPASVLAMTLRRSLGVVLVGIAVGGIGAFALTRVMRNLLFEVSPTDPLTLIVVVLVLTAIAGLASYVPARRGTRVDPLITMRVE